MRVRIVCYEDVDKWILGKFAKKLHENLVKLGVESSISKTPDNESDINHHIIYLDYEGKKNSVDTLMITHIDNIAKKNLLNKHLQIAEMGICMSRDTLDNLVNLGISREKLCFVNPAHDGVIIPKTKIVGITCRVQDDGRKREIFLSKLAKDISPVLFSFKIMGDGWDNQVDCLRKYGFTVEYTNRFIYEEYIKLIPSLDYYLYMGQDEGQMGFVDALSAGVETIVTPQGYHLDAKDGITYSFNKYEELRDVFIGISKKSDTLIKSVSTWNWSDYAKKHVEIWEYLLAIKNNKSYHMAINNVYIDGIRSVSKYDKNVVVKKNKLLLKICLISELVKHNYYTYKKILHESYKKYGFFSLLLKLLKRMFIVLFK